MAVGVEGGSARVSVVIPSVDRPSVRAAVASALAQDLAPYEVVVVRDRPDGSPGTALPDDARVRVVATGGGAGPSGARALGVERARGDLVAFLDDDDTWEPDKLRRQVAEHARLTGLGAVPLVSCRARIVQPHRPGDALVAPARAYRPGDGDVGDHMFVRHGLTASGFTLASSTFLCSRELARAMPWRRDLRLHEDWDWVLRLTRSGVTLSVLPEPLVHYLQPQHATGTASRPDGGWLPSAAWARDAGLSRRALGDFLLTVSAAQALQAGRRWPALRLAVEAARRGRPGLAAWVTFGLQLVVPPVLLQRLAAAVHRATRRR